MKKLLVILSLALSVSAIASVDLKLGLYVPVDGDSCAFQVVKQSNDGVYDGVVVIFRYNPTVTPTRKCADGFDYPIRVDVLDSERFVDARTDREFVYYGEY